jgi:hypothetical protein
LEVPQFLPAYTPAAVWLRPLQQCIEALRLYAAAHEGKFPKELSRITEVPVPNDPVMQKPFVYRCTGSDAVLEAPAPEGATERDAIRYELSLKE